MADILKFNKDFLEGHNIKIHKKLGDTSYEIHRHDYYEIIYYKNCAGSCNINGMKYEITESCLFLLTPDDYHKIEAKNTNESYSIIISFSESLIDQALLGELGFCARAYYSPTDKTVAMLLELIKIYNENSAHRILKLNSYFNIILSDVLENADKIGESGALLSDTVRCAMAIVLSDISAEHSMAEIADTVGLNYSYFSDLFHKQTGKTFKDWISEIRIEHAKRLLEETSESVLKILYDSGYNTPSQFFKVFKKKTGISPEEYRKKFSNPK